MLAAMSRLMLQSPHLGPLPLAFRSSFRDSGVEKSQSGVVLEEESLGLLLVLGESTLPGDLGLQPVSVVEGDLGGEGVVGEGVVSTSQLLAVDLDGPLVAAASSGNLESLELLAVGLDLKQLAGVVVHSHGVFVHVAVDLVEEDGHEEVELVGLLVGGQEHLHGS